MEQEKKVIGSFYVDDEMYKAVKDEAKKQGRPITNMVRYIIQMWMCGLTQSDLEEMKNGYEE